MPRLYAFGGLILCVLFGLFDIIASLSEFFDAPYEVFDNSCTKEQLMQIAKHYEINVADKKCKAEVKDIFLSAFVEIGVLKRGELFVGRGSGANIHFGVCTRVRG